MINYLLPSKAATKQELGHPAAGVIGWIPDDQNTSGVTVTEDIALNFAAVWCATRIISETVASLPCILYRRMPDGSKERATMDPRYALMHDAPHPEISAYTWFETLTAHIVTWGNCYAKVIRDSGFGMPQQLEPRLPNTVTIDRDAKNDDIIYEVSDPQETLDRDTTLHVHGLGYDGLQGYSVVSRAQQSIGSGMAAERYAGGLYGNSGVPKGLLKHPAKLTKVARDNYRKEWDEIHRGSGNSAKIGILTGGVEYQQTAMSNEDAQFLQSREFAVTEIARWFRLPPHMLADLKNSSVRANIEQQAIEFVVYSIMPWLRRWETALTRKLLREEERQELFFEFLTDSLLRGDIKSRYEAYAIGKQWGWLNTNEIRARENMNGTGPDGDIYLQPLNMSPAGTPDTLREDMQQSLGDSLSQIVDAGKQLKEQLSSAAVAQVPFDSAQLAYLREEREEIRQELWNLGKAIQVRGCDVEQRAIRKAATELYRDQLEQCVAVEAMEAIKAAKRVDRGESFVNWLEAFYGQHERMLRDRISKAISAYCLGDNARAEWLCVRLAEQHCAKSQALLLDAADGDRDTFTKRIKALVADWRERAKDAQIDADTER